MHTISTLPTEDCYSWDLNNYKQKDNPLTWLDDVLGVEHQNFFEGRATSYQKAGLRGDYGKLTFAGFDNENETK